MFRVNRQVYYRSIQYKQTVVQKRIILVKGIPMRTPRLGGRKLYYFFSNELLLLKLGRDKS